MRAVVKKWGKRAFVRIPAAALKAANLYLDEPVNVHEESGRIVIEAAKTSFLMRTQLVELVL